MAFVVEDGSGKADANGYISVAFANSYHAARGRTDWVALSDADCELAIVRASDYIDLRFGPRFRGTRISPSQALQWPRYGAFDNSGYLYSGDRAVPIQIQKACAEYALIASRVGELAPNPPSLNGKQSVTGVISGDTPPVGALLSERSKVGNVEQELHYAQDPKQTYRMSPGGLISASNIPEYPLADLWIMELVRSSTAGDLRRA